MGLYLAMLPLSLPKIAREMFDIGPPRGCCTRQEASVPVLPEPSGQTPPSAASMQAQAFFRGPVIKIHRSLFRCSPELVRGSGGTRTAAAPRSGRIDIGFMLSWFRPVLLLQIVRLSTGGPTSGII